MFEPAKTNEEAVDNAIKHLSIVYGLSHEVMEMELYGALDYWWDRANGVFDVKPTLPEFLLYCARLQEAVDLTEEAFAKNCGGK